MTTRPDDTIRPGVPTAIAKRMFAAAADPDRTIRPKELLIALATLPAMLLTDHQAQGGDPARLRAAFDAMVNETLGIRPSGSTH